MKRVERIRDAVRLERARQVRPLRSANRMEGPTGPRPCACCQEQLSAGSSLGAKLFVAACQYDGGVGLTMPVARDALPWAPVLATARDVGKP